MNKNPVLIFTLFFQMISSFAFGQLKDTIAFGYTFKITEVTEDEYKSIPLIEPINWRASREEDLLKRDSNLAKRKDSILTIKYGKKEMIFANNSQSINKSVFIYRGMLPHAEYFMIEVAGFEWDDILLINKSTGDSIIFSYNLLFSKDNKHLLDFGMGTMLLRSVIAEYSLSNGILKMDWQFRIQGWNIGWCKWLDDSTFYAPFVATKSLHKCLKISFSKLKK